MKIIIVIVSLLVLISLHAFADTYTVSLDADQDAALSQRAAAINMLPDDFIQELVSEYCDGMIDEEVEMHVKQLSKHERRALARQYLNANKRHNRK
ncbi:MAG: hypothetical protein JW938_01275 [Candidatus Omnitrophica bacterium]|nr:hypothetical protein [Candidatus Omnitrophota bacterium]